MVGNDSDKNIFEQIYNAYKQDMYAVAFRILNNKFSAEDAVHDAFVRIAKNLKKITEAKCPQTRAFAVIIVRNTAIDIYNKNKKHSENTYNIDDCYNLMTEDDSSQGMNCSTLSKSIKSLPNSLKDALYLKCVIGHSTKSTAKLLGITTDAVHKRIQRARKMLAQNINNGG